MHLYADISSHGFGHLAQTAPVLTALRRRLPELRLTVRCGLPRERIALRLDGPFTHLPEATDFGLVMKNALDVDAPASLAAYESFHERWEERVALEARRLTALAPDLVLSNVSYLTLAAARRAGLPAVALGSLNWLAVATPYLGARPGFAAIGTHMLSAYREVEAFLRLTPGMDMPGLPVTSVGPVAAPGRPRRERLPAGRLVLVVMGGVGLRLPGTWPRLPGVTWIAPREAGPGRPDFLAIEDTGLTVSELIASVDCVLTKAGYGTFVEAAASGTPLLYVARPDWPEEPALTAWHARVSRSAPLTREAFERGAFGEAVLAMLEGPRPEPVALTGVDEVADRLAALLSGKAS